MKLKSFPLVAAIASLLLCSCASRESFVYLSDMTDTEQVPFDLKHQATVLPDDRLNINVSCKNPELAIPFNVRSGAVSVSESGEVSTQTSDAAHSYRVDSDGNIDYPILGKLHLGGLTLSQCTALIAERIRSGNYISDPLVSVEFLNFRYTVMGAVSHNGTFTSASDRVTLLEAIANAGNVSANARLDRVVVIRQEGNKQQKYYHDLTSKSLFSSPCYYLQQNDLVYVEPKYRAKTKEDRAIQYGTVGLSAVTAVCTLLYLLKK